jgi:hypothetical protein
MARHVCKLSFHRNVLRLGLAICLAALMILVLPGISAPAAASPPQDPSHDRDKVTANMEGALKTITGSENSQGTHEPGVDDPTSQTASSGKKNRAAAQANFEQAKHDAMQLSGLAQALQLELSQSNGNVLSLDVIDKAAKIEKLAKKIKGTAKGF